MTPGRSPILPSPRMGHPLSLSLQQRITWNCRRSVATDCLSSQDVKKHDQRILLLREVLRLALAPAANPAPRPRETHVSEQSGCHVEHVVPRHVSGRLNSFDIDTVGLCAHTGRIENLPADVQRQFRIGSSIPIHNFDAKCLRAACHRTW